MLDFASRALKPPKCANCGKPKGDHKAHSFNCPRGAKHRTLGYLAYDRLNVFTNKQTPA